MKINLSVFSVYVVFILNRSTLISYGIIGSLISLLLISAPYRLPKKDGSVILTIALLLLWLYGLILGFARGNNPAWVVQNFGGMVLYTLGLFVIRSNAEKKKAIRAIHFSAIYILLISIVIKVVLMQGPALLGSLRAIFGNFGISFSQNIFQPRITLTGHLTSFLPMIFAYIFITGSRATRGAIHQVFDGSAPKIYRNVAYAIFWIVIYLFMIIAINQSKGAILAIAFLFLVVSVSTTFALRTGVKVRILEFAFLVVLLLLIVLGLNYFGSLAAEDSAGNAKRYLQIKVLWENVTFWGHGLGAEVPGAAELRGGRTFENNESEKLYAVEIIYLNIFHKFGIFAVIIPISYIYVFVKAVRQIITARTDLERGFAISALALMGYTVVGIGNPLLLGPGAIVLHVIALRLLARV